MITITEPPDFSLYAVNLPVACTADVSAPSDPATVVWTASVNGGAATAFGMGPKAVYTTPMHVVNTDPNGNKTLDLVEITCTGQAMASMQPESDHVFIGVCEGDPKNDHTNMMMMMMPPGGDDTMDPKDKVSLDSEGGRQDGVTDLSLPTADDLGSETNNIPDGGGSSDDVSLTNEDGGGDEGGGGSKGGIGCTPCGPKNKPMHCPDDMVGRASRIIAGFRGAMRIQKAWGSPLYTRGETVDLGLYYCNLPSGLLANGEVPAGPKKSFGWQTRIIQDLVGRVVIYYGDRRVEAWVNPDGAGNYTGFKGVFGTLNRNTVTGAFTRITKDCIYYDFDSTGKLKTIKDRSQDGNTIYFNYNTNTPPQLIRITGPGVGFKPYFTYDASNRAKLMSLESANPTQNRVTYYNYDASGRLNTVIAPDASLAYFNHDANDNISVEINELGVPTTFAYTTDTIPRIQKVLFAKGASQYFTYDDTFPRSTRQQAGYPTQYFDYNWAGLAFQATTGNLEKVVFDYDDNSKPTMAQSTDGGLTYYTWDSQGQVLSRKGCQGFTDSYTYGTKGNVTSWTDQLGRTTYWNYDAPGYQSNWIDARHQVTYFTRDTFGHIVSKKDRRGNVTYYTYDSFGSISSTKYPDGGLRYFVYNPAAEIEVLIDQAGKVTYFDHDKRGRITRWKDAAGQLTQYGFDKKSNLISIVDRRGGTTYFTYDQLSRLTARTTPLRNSTYFDYDTGNLKTLSIDPRGGVTYFFYTPVKTPLGFRNPVGGLTYFTYTIAGMLANAKDPRGNTTSMQYDCHYRLNAYVDASGNVTYYTYDNAGNESSIKDARGFVSYFYFDELQRRIAFRDPFKAVSYFYYDTESNLTTYEDALKRRTYFSYDSLNHRVASDDPLKGHVTWTYDTRGLLTGSTDELGRLTYYSYNALKALNASVDPKGGVTYFQYDPEIELVAKTDPRGATTSLSYDLDRRLVAIITPLGEKTYYAYDAGGNRTSVKDPRGNLSYLYYDSLNRNFAQSDQSGALTYFTYDATSNLSSVKDPISRVRYFYFDKTQRLFAIRNALNGLRYFTYDRTSNNDSVKDENNHVTYLSFDARRRPIVSRSAVGGLTYLAYDLVGNLISVKDPVVRLNYYYYDALKRRIASEDGLQRRTYFTYDAAGNLISAKNPRRATVSPSEVGIQYLTYDSLDRRTSVKDELGNVRYYDYDANSNQTVQRNPKGALTYWTYDANNRRTSLKDPLARSTYWTYDPAGNINSLKDGKAQVTYYQFSAVNLTVRVDYPDLTKHYYEYDKARQETAFADPTGRTTFGYDSLGRLIVRSNPGAQNLYFRYDAAGNKTSLIDPDNVPVYYVYDGANRLTNHQAPTYGGAVAYYEYTLADEVVTERRHNGTVTYYRYDKAGRLSLIDHEKNGLVLIEKYTYTRDEVGNLLQIVRSSDSMSTYFNYDAASRATKEAWRTSAGVDVYGFNYSYDTAGNRLFKQKTAPTPGATTYWEYDLADQILRQRLGGPVTVYFTYDQNGNLIVEHDTNASAGRTYYTYDPRNLVNLIDFPGATATNYFQYNAAAERVRKDDSTGGKKYTWDGLVTVLEKNLANTTVQRMLKGYALINGIGEYSLQDLGGTVIYPHKNQVGTTQRHTDTTGAVKNYYEYDAWGQPFAAQQATAQQYRFTGKELDPDFIDFNSANRRYHFPARVYVPFRGLFLQRDPLIIVPAFKLPAFSITLLKNYLYVDHNPLNIVDPRGEQGNQTPPSLGTPPQGLSSSTFAPSSSGGDGFLPSAATYLNNALQSTFGGDAGNYYNDPAAWLTPQQIEMKSANTAANRCLSALLAPALGTLTDGNINLNDFLGSGVKITPQVTPNFGLSATIPLGGGSTFTLGAVSAYGNFPGLSNAVDTLNAAFNTTGTAPNYPNQLLNAGTAVQMTAGVSIGSLNISGNVGFNTQGGGPAITGGMLMLQFGF